MLGLGQIVLLLRGDRACLRWGEQMKILGCDVSVNHARLTYLAFTCAKRDARVAGQVVNLYRSAAVLRNRGDRRR